jgi:hypothetical protein
VMHVGTSSGVRPVVVAHKYSNYMLFIEIILFCVL